MSGSNGSGVSQVVGRVELSFFGASHVRRSKINVSARLTGLGQCTVDGELAAE